MRTSFSAKQGPHGDAEARGGRSFQGSQQRRGGDGRSTALSGRVDRTRSDHIIEGSGRPRWHWPRAEARVASWDLALTHLKGPLAWSRDTEDGRAQPLSSCTVQKRRRSRKPGGGRGHLRAHAHARDPENAWAVRAGREGLRKSHHRGVWDPQDELQFTRERTDVTGRGHSRRGHEAAGRHRIRNYRRPWVEGSRWLLRGTLMTRGDR